MAISAPSAVGTNSAAAPVGTSLAVAVTLTAGETGVAFFFNGEGASDAIVSSFTGGGTWAFRGRVVNRGTARYMAEVWSTAPGALTSASTCTAAWAGSPNVVGCAVGSYPGVVALGGVVVRSPGAASANPTVVTAIQGKDNWAVAGVCHWSNVAFSAGTGTERVEAGQTGASDIRFALVDNSGTAIGQALTTSEGSGSGEWAAIALELWPTTIPATTDAPDFTKPSIAERETNRLAGVA